MHRRAFLHTLCLAALGLAAPPVPAHALVQIAQAQPRTSVRTPLGPLPPVVKVEGPLEFRARTMPGGGSQLAFECRNEGQIALNPLLRVRKGQRLQVKLVNDLAEPTTIHWHGLDADWTQAGHPSAFVTAPGQSFQTDFEITNRAGTYWYHAHPDMLTGKQVHQGLAGMIVVDDEEDEALAKAMDFQLGESDVPLFIQDRRLDAQGLPVYAPSAEDLVSGLYGDTVFVNGEANPSFSLPARGYRLRLLNASNARSYLLAFQGAGQGGTMPVQLLGVDGGLLSKPVSVNRLFLSPGERADVYLDLSGEALVGRILTLTSQPFDPMHLEMAMPGRERGADAGAGHAGEGGHGGRAGDMPSMAHGGQAGEGASMGGMDMTPGAGMSSPAAAKGGPGGHQAGHGGALPDGSALNLCRFVVTEGKAVKRTLPRMLSRLAPQPTVKLGATRTVRLGFQHTSQTWSIDGLTYKADQTPIVVPRRGQEVWEFVNERLSMPHPMHLHGYSFRILSRQGSPAQVADLAVGPGGVLPSDLGRKDTFLLWPGERVRVAIDFSRPAYQGEQKFVLHCHNLEHEDHGMMLNFKVAG